MSNNGRSVRLYLVDGVASGILTAEIMNWTGHALAAPRTRLEAALSRPEMKRTGVYFLVGIDDEDNDLWKVYVGEGDEIGKRLYQHNKEKDFWDRFISITSKDMNLTKAHVRYLEGKLLDMASKAKKAKIENKDMPQFDLLPEADIADMDGFLEEINLILPVIGADFLRKAQGRVPTRSVSGSSVVPVRTPELEGLAQQEESETFVLVNPKAGIDAKAREVGGEFIVLAGSIGSLKERSSFSDKERRKRKQAFQMGSLENHGESNFVLVEDISFTSPSAAAVFLFGTSRNGRADWLLEGAGKSYGHWKDEKIESARMVLE